MNYETITTILLGVLGTITTLLVVLLQRKTERLKIVEAQLSERKYDAYGRLVSIFYEIIKTIKADKSTDELNIMEKMIESKKDIFIFGSDIVFRKFNEWLAYTSNYPNDLRHFKHFLDLLIEIRKDMGHKATKITREDILASLIQNKATIEEFRRQIF